MKAEIRERLFAASPDHGGSHERMVVAINAYRRVEPQAGARVKAALERLVLEALEEKKEIPLARLVDLGEQTFGAESSRARVRNAVNKLVKDRLVHWKIAPAGVLGNGGVLRNFVVLGPKPKTMLRLKGAKG
jgi:hypothetical protein